MKHNHLWRAARVALLSGVAVLGGVAGAAPVIMSPEPTFNFGEVNNDQKVVRDFVIKNAGDEPLQITDVKTTCGCTVAKPAVNTLAPGEETKVTVTFDLKGKQGPQTKKITVLTNDPQTPQYYLELTGTSVALVMLEPGLINFGKIEDTEPRTEKIRVYTTRPDYTFELTDVTVSGAAPVTAVVEPVAAGRDYNIVVTTNPNLMPGSIAGEISVSTSDTSRPPMKIRIFGTVIGPLKVQPPRVSIQSTANPEEGNRTQFLQITAGRTKEFELLEAISPVEGMGVELIKRKDNDYHVKLTNIPLDNTLKGKEIIIRTNLPDSPEIRIPIDVRPARPVRAGRTPARVPAEDGVLTAPTATTAVPPQAPVKPAN